MRWLGLLIILMVLTGGCKSTSVVSTKSRSTETLHVDTTMVKHRITGEHTMVSLPLELSQGPQPMVLEKKTGRSVIRLSVKDSMITADVVVKDTVVQVPRVNTTIERQTTTEVVREQKPGFLRQFKNALVFISTIIAAIAIYRIVKLFK